MGLLVSSAVVTPCADVLCEGCSGLRPASDLVSSPHRTCINLAVDAVKQTSQTVWQHGKIVTVLSDATGCARHRFRPSTSGHATMDPSANSSDRHPERSDGSPGEAAARRADRTSGHNATDTTAMCRMGDAVVRHEAILYRSIVCRIACQPHATVLDFTSEGRSAACMLMCESRVRLIWVAGGNRKGPPSRCCWEWSAALSPAPGTTSA
jgi:hypothetical protein